MKHNFTNVCCAGILLKIVEAKGKGFKCKSSNHHTAVCEQQRKFTLREIDNSNSALVVRATSNVLLQPLDCYMLYTPEEKAMKIKILMDSGSHQTSVSEKVVDFLGLKQTDKHLVSIQENGKGM